MKDFNVADFINEEQFFQKEIRILKDLIYFYLFKMETPLLNETFAKNVSKKVV